MDGKYSLRNIARNTPEYPILLFLFEHGPIGIRAMMDNGVASQSGLNRAIRDLILAGLVEYDNSRTKPGRPLMLTKQGKAISLKVAELEEVAKRYFPQDES